MTCVSKTRVNKNVKSQEYSIFPINLYFLYNIPVDQPIILVACVVYLKKFQQKKAIEKFEFEFLQLSLPPLLGIAEFIGEAN